ncbi:hypothetical protein E4T56_gene8957 [Termitomyces sp. T112]|nr:hypothetical protein E4T56_gene8957 [Termitomyces sp. T112]
MMISIMRSLEMFSYISGITGNVTKISSRPAIMYCYLNSLCPGFLIKEVLHEVNCRASDATRAWAAPLHGAGGPCWRSPFPALRPSIHDCMALPTPIVAQYLLQIDYRTRSTTEH